MTSSSLFFKAETSSGENDLFPCRENLLVKCSKTSNKIYKHLVQQKVQQKFHNVHDVSFIKHIWF